MPTAPGNPTTNPTAVPTTSQNPFKDTGGPLPDYWAAFIAYTILIIVAELGENIAHVAAALAVSIALVAGMNWLLTLKNNGQRPFGTKNFWE